MESDTRGIAKPFMHSAVTSDVAVALGLVDLKVAAAFYDKITIIDLSLFDEKLPEFLGLDYEFLINQGIIEVQDYHSAVDINKGELGYDFAKAIKNHMGATPFTNNERKKLIGEVAGNGIARLHTALRLQENPQDELTPIVTACVRADGFSDEVRIDGAPLPADVQLEELLPVRATATRVLFNKLPVPGRDTPWDDILRFRSDADTGLYAARLRILLRRLGKEEDRRHVVDLVQSEFADFEARLRLFKRSRRVSKVQMVLPWMDALNSLIKALTFAKPSEAVLPYIQMEKQQIEMSEAERKITSDPYYMIEHVKSRLAW